MNEQEVEAVIRITQLLQPENLEHGFRVTHPMFVDYAEDLEMDPHTPVTELIEKLDEVADQVEATSMSQEERRFGLVSGRGRRMSASPQSRIRILANDFRDMNRQYREQTGQDLQLFNAYRALMRQREPDIFRVNVPRLHRHPFSIRNLAVPVVAELGGLGGAGGFGN